MLQVPLAVKFNVAVTIVTYFFLIMQNTLSSVIFFHHAIQVQLAVKNALLLLLNHLQHFMGFFYSIVMELFYNSLANIKRLVM